MGGKPPNILYSTTMIECQSVRNMEFREDKD